jgi:hypothetical protein
MAEAQRHAADMRQQSEHMISCLDAFKRNFLATVTESTAGLRAA